MMKMSLEIDLAKSLRNVLGSQQDFEDEVKHDSERQTKTAKAILRRFFGANERERRELMILADEVGLGKTYVALAVAVSILDAIRRGEAPEGLPANQPVVMVLTPTNDALFNKWMREAAAFKTDCARTDGSLDWLQISCPIEETSKTGNIIHITNRLREATRSKPTLFITKQGSLGASLHDRDLWRRRALAAAFSYFHTPNDKRRYWCRKGKVFDNFGIPELNDLLDLRRAGYLWDDSISPNLERAFSRALDVNSKFTERLAKALNGKDEELLARVLDDFGRHALASDWPQIPLVIIDEIHGLKNEGVQARSNFEAFAQRNVCRMLGLSATPFQLRHDELLSILKMRSVLKLDPERHERLNVEVTNLEISMKVAREKGDIFRRRWKGLQKEDEKIISDEWTALLKLDESEKHVHASQVRPPRVAHALVAALELEQCNSKLRLHLGPFVIRHQHVRGYREHFVGNAAASLESRGSLTFSWSPGIQTQGEDELAQYLMMRAVALAKDERGLPSLGAELTGSYRHLIETSAVWKKLAKASNPLLRKYRGILEEMIGTRSGNHDPDAEHRKIQVTVKRAMQFFEQRQKSLIFCVHTKTAESIRDLLANSIDQNLGEQRNRIFGGAEAFENFRRRFFNRRETLFSLIQDQPLLGKLSSGGVGVEQPIALTDSHLRQVAELMVQQGEYADTDKPDRRLLIAATEHVAVRYWRENADGKKWLSTILKNCQNSDPPQNLENIIADPKWLEGREPLSKIGRGGRDRQELDPHADANTFDPLEAEEIEVDSGMKPSQGKAEESIDAWERRIREEPIGEIVAPYFQNGLIAACAKRQPLLAQHHGDLLAEFDLKTRTVAGQVFRRLIMAEEFLLRYLADAAKEPSERWADYLSVRYVKPLDGHLESLCDRVHAYFETLVRAQKNAPLLSGYHAAAENRNVVQLVKGDTQNRDRYFLGFNTPYRPEILISTSVGQEGIDLHRECRHVIHHDLCWNPATIEQRTGRVDRIGSKVERERKGGDPEAEPSLEIVAPYLAATYDERMFEELYRRAQLFEVTLGGDMRVEGRIEPETVISEKKIRDSLGIGNDDEDLGVESSEAGVVDIPAEMIEQLRVDLSVWKPAK